MKNLLCCLSLSLLSVVTQAADKKDETVQLQSTFVGDKEQPTVSYFIPWQGAGGPDTLYRNIEGRHDHSLQAVDREVLIKSMRMYDDMNLESSAAVQ